MNKYYFLFFICLLSLYAEAQTVVETVSSGTSGDATLKIEADTDNNNESDNPRIELVQDGGGLGAYIGFNADWGGVAPDNLFRIGTRYSNVDNYNRIVINGQNGNIGMGTSNPNGKLDIYGANSNTTNLILSANYIDKHRWRFNTIDRGYAIDMDITVSDGADNQEAVLKLSRSNSTRPEFQLYNNAIVANNGNVGIGTATPEYKLHVTSGGQIRKTTLGVTLASAENSWIRDEWLTGSYGPAKWNQSIAKWVRPSGTYNDIGGIVYQDEGTYFLRDGAGTQLEYTNAEFLNNAFMFAHIITGNIGIGTITPDSKLTVAGKIHAQEVKVTINAGADFVFNDDYKLPSLKEVEKYIKENKHLPEIASEKEMQDNGLLLAEMNIKLLQKVEELTLYTIQQDKKLKEQDATNQELKERLLKLEHLLLSNDQKN
ncbi:tail fiber protein [Flavivirga sp. 57AJ16]|uniref:tail fiber protein n=1 Tax=Flavivirga sp. 57AJ16 TaxID=3025307 RepID=UPI0023651A5D|nr:tail fiber protein [Flavivirga sp. 57AJ16]MDD7886030.1 tail fiber protein [Flavivirga sp. 57AJ16]